MKKPETQNLTEWITGRNLNVFQKADAVIEYNKLLDYVSELEQLPIQPVSNRRELFKCDCGGTNHYKNEIHDSVMCADCGTVYCSI